jgi:hypothetical protein
MVAHIMMNEIREFGPPYCDFDNRRRNKTFWRSDNTLHPYPSYDFTLFSTMITTHLHHPMDEDQISSFDDLAISAASTSVSHGFPTPASSSFTLALPPLSTTPKLKGEVIQPWKGWPPQYLGTVPPTDEAPADYTDLIRIREGMFSDLDKLSLDYKTMKCSLVECWSAELVKSKEALFLQLPQFTMVNEVITASKWRNLSNDEYPSRQLLVRECYVKIANALFANVSAKANKMMQQMMVSGTPRNRQVVFLQISRLETPPSGWPIHYGSSGCYCVL